MRADQGTTEDAEGRICAVASTPIPGLTTMTGYLYDAAGTRVAKGTITAWSCDPTANGFQTTSDYVLGAGGEQLTEMAVGANNTLTWQHTNVWAGGKLLATYDANGLHYYSDDPLGSRRIQTDIQKVLDFYGPLSTKAGDKGDNGVNVSFGSLKKNELGKAELGADGHTVNIKLDWGQLNSVGRGSSIGSGGMSLGLGAGLLIHEGTHGVDERNWGHMPLTRGQEDWTEHNAYRNESYTFQGLDFPFTSLWKRGMTDDEPNAAIDEGSNASDAAAGDR